MTRKRPSNRARMAASRPAQTAQIDIPSTPVANPTRTRLEEAPVPVTVRPLEVVTLYGVFNDAQRIAELVEAGEMAPHIAELFKQPLLLSEMPGEVKREVNRVNRYRFENPRESLIGPATMRKQTVTRTEWEIISGSEWDDIDDGTRPNG